MFDNYRDSIFIIQKAVQEAKRDPLKDMDTLAIPDTIIHGQVIGNGKTKSSSKNIDTSVQKNDRGHSPSDADTVTDGEQANQPFKGPDVKDPLLKDQKTADSILETEYPWDKCMEDQMKEYGSKEKAQKVCGSIKAKYGG